MHTGRWHGDERYFGLHCDLHAGALDTELGSRSGEDEPAPMLRLMPPEIL